MKKKKRGRPKSDKNKDVYIGARVESWLKSGCEYAAKKEDKDLSVWLRDLLIESIPD